MTEIETWKEQLSLDVRNLEIVHTAADQALQNQEITLTQYYQLFEPYEPLHTIIHRKYGVGSSSVINWEIMLKDLSSCSEQLQKDVFPVLKEDIIKIDNPELLSRIIKRLMVWEMTEMLIDVLCLVIVDPGVSDFRENKNLINLLRWFFMFFWLFLIV
eukprot:TRINITY_DN1657_c0_g1_i2.p1 TRINITY_DN1657_c0_g1~~TRINITY_DN1657_c0_g1_i2.p1  ORF type:complete len:158 (+),score=28.57 TRINITY_DN1657_c0_g1_i2:90-563(+)